MKLAPRARIVASIPTAPMAVLVVLAGIFFLSSTVRDVERTVVGLPLAVNRVAAEVGSPVVVLLEPSDGRVVYGLSNGTDASQEVLSLEQLQREASQLIAVDPGLRFVLEASGSTKFDEIDKLLEALRGAGVRRLLLLAEQRPAGES